MPYVSYCLFQMKTLRLVEGNQGLIQETQETSDFGCFVIRDVSLPVVDEKLQPRLGGALSGRSSRWRRSQRKVRVQSASIITCRTDASLCEHA